MSAELPLSAYIIKYIIIIIKFIISYNIINKIIRAVFSKGV